MANKIISSSNQGLGYIGTFLSQAVNDVNFQSIQSIFSDTSNPNNWTATEMQSAIDLIANTTTFLNGTSDTGFIPDAKNFLVGVFYNSLITRLQQLKGEIITIHDPLLKYTLNARVRGATDSKMYKSLVNNNQGNIPESSPTNWESPESLIGDYKHSARTSNHNGWSICDGQAILRTTYSALFAVIGTSFGIGDSITTFNLPDARGRIAGAMGQGGGLTSRTLGTNVGEEMHTQTVDEMPSHNHSASNGTTQADGSLFEAASGTVSYSISTNNTGGGQPFNVMQPTLFIGNLFIYSGV